MATVVTRFKVYSDEYKKKINENSSMLQRFGAEGKNAGAALGQFDKMMGTSLSTIGKMSVALAGVSAALKVTKDALANNEVIFDEWNATVKSAESVYDGFLNALNTGDISGYLQHMDDIVNAARAAYDALDELETYNAFNQINVEKTRQGLTESIANYREGKGSKADVRSAGESVKKELQQRQKLEQQAYEAAVKDYAAKRNVNAQMLMKALSGNYGSYNTLKNLPLTGNKNVLIPNSGGKTYSVATAANEQEKLGQMLRQLNDDELQGLQALGAQAYRTGVEMAQVDKQVARIAKQTKVNGSGGAGGRGGRGGGSNVPMLDTSVFTDAALNIPDVAPLNDQLAITINSLQEVKKYWEEALNSASTQEDLSTAVTNLSNTNDRIKAMQGGNAFPVYGISGIQGLSVTEEQMKDFYGDNNKKDNSELHAQLSQAIGGINSIASGMNQLGIDLPEGLTKAISAVEGIMSIIQGINAVLGVMESLSAARDSAYQATVVSELATIAAASVTTAATNWIPFANGGIVGAANGILVGNGTYHGDTNFIRANDGEMMINQTDQRNLYDMIHGNSLTVNQGGGQSIVRGSDIYLSLRNYMRQNHLTL